MALDLTTAKRMAAQYGAQPPAGADPDAWVMEWFQNGVNSGDPALVEAAGGTKTEGGGGVRAPWENAAPSSEWLGKRNPTPSELRRYSREAGFSEDYDRYDDRQLAAWVNKNWNTQGGFFTNDYGDRVEKPTESGAQSKAAGAATGEKGGGGAGGAGGGGAGGGGGKGGKYGDWYTGTENPELRDRLMGLFEQGGGYFDPKQRAGVMTNEGGMIWRDPITQSQSQTATGPGGGAPAPGGQPTAMNPTIPGSGTPPPTTAPTAPPGSQPGNGMPGGGMLTNQASPALVSATLNAFSPQAPSKQATGAPMNMSPASPAAPQNMKPMGMPPAVQPATPSAVASPTTTGTSPLMGALSQKFANKNQWWMGGQKNYTV